MSEDRFRTEIERLHAVRRAIRELDDVGREAFIRSLTETGSGAPDDRLLTARDANSRRSATGRCGCFSAVAAPANRARCRRRCEDESSRSRTSLHHII